MLLLLTAADCKPLELKFVQLKIITGELSCKSGNDEEIVEVPLIVLVNFEAHVATDVVLLNFSLLPLLLLKLLPAAVAAEEDELLLNCCCC